MVFITWLRGVDSGLLSRAFEQPRQAGRGPGPYASGTAAAVTSGPLFRKPGHAFAQLRTHLLDGVLDVGFQHLGVLAAAVGVLLDPLARELAVLDLLEDAP